MKTILERHNIVWMAKSKIGLAFLTMFLSRAEMLKQLAPQQGPEAPSEQDLFLWSEIYNFLFASMQGNFVALFPKSEESEAKGVKKHAGEIYIWQFLAALAVGATSADQQKILVSEVRYVFILFICKSGLHSPLTPL
jgi:hypothetical protein